MTKRPLIPWPEVPATVWLVLILAGTLACAWAIVSFFASYGERLGREALVVTASSAAVAFHDEEVASLGGDAGDLNTRTLHQVRETLRGLRSAMPGARFAYLLGLRNGELIFLADGEAEDSPDYSPPGQIYEGPSSGLREVFATGKALVEGPVTDRWGTWVSALAPVIDHESGKVIAVFGLDISAEDWTASIMRYRLLGFAVSGILAAVVLFFGMLIHRQQRLSRNLAIADRIVKNSSTILYRLSGDPGMPMTFISNNVRKLGYEPRAFIEQPTLYRSLVHPDDGPIVEDAQRREMEGEDPGPIHFRVRTSEGSYRWFETQDMPVYDDSKRLISVEGMIIDITDSRLAAEELQFANTLANTTMETSPDGILVVDENARIISFNQRFGDLFNIPPEVLDAGDDEPVLGYATQQQKDPAAFLDRVRYLYAHPEETAHEEIELNDGRYIERHTAPLTAESGKYLGRVWFFRDITSRKLDEAAIRHSSRHDALTGLANRRAFMEAVEQAIARAERGERSFAVLYLDLDHFKDVNDTLGHPVGDALLCAVADRLRSGARQIDLVARFGGDEFAVVAAAIDDPADAAQLADRLIGVFAQPFIIQGHELHCGASIGIAVYEAGSKDAELLLSHADEALYREKAERRGGYHFFTDAMDVEVRTRVTLIAELRRARESDQLFLEYQPQIDLGTGRIAGVEALVRWRHPRRGLLLPEDFMPIAEKAGLVVDLDRRVLRDACHQAKEWLDAGIEPLVVSVNVSGVTLKMAIEFEKSLLAELDTTRLPPEWLELELTETVFMEASREHLDVITRLRQRGVAFALDDFGTGYSSLDYLRRYPAQRLKIAQVFVEQIARDAGSAAIVKAIIGLAREMGMVSIAEGVEAGDQLTLLKGWGCLQVQGFYLARPFKAADLTPFLRRGVAAHAGSETRAGTA